MSEESAEIHFDVLIGFGDGVGPGERSQAHAHTHTHTLDGPYLGKVSKLLKSLLQCL